MNAHTYIRILIVSLGSKPNINSNLIAGSSHDFARGVQDARRMIQPAPALREGTSVTFQDPYSNPPGFWHVHR